MPETGVNPLNTNSSPGAAPSWRVEGWLNTDDALSLEKLEGKVVVLHAFQMLCPGCVSHGLPQAQRVHDSFDHDKVSVIGLHTVFEHHEAMTPAALKAFVHEYRLTFPIGIDRPNGSGAPKTMTAYQMQGTPTLILIDKRGRLRRQIFGQC
ncbi:MAG: TlpA disulfide reductase family protein, partial [Mariprofundaceae bacterium]